MEKIPKNIRKDFNYYKKVRDFIQFEEDRKIELAKIYFEKDDYLNLSLDEVVTIVNKQGIHYDNEW